MEKTDDSFIDLWKRLEAMIQAGKIAPEQLEGFLNGMERKFSRRHKKLAKQNLVVENGRKVDFTELLGYQASRLIWQKDMVPELQPPAGYLLVNDPIFFNERFSWQTVWLNGFSIEQIARRFPDDVEISRLFRHPWVKERALPGYYLVSLQNPLINLSPETERAQTPADCQPLPGNLLLELLVSLRHIKKPVNLEIHSNGYPIYYRTNHDNGRHVRFCLGQKGWRPSIGHKPLIFTRATGSGYKPLIAVCLMKYREFEIEE